MNNKLVIKDIISALNDISEDYKNNSPEEFRQLYGANGLPCVLSTIIEALTNLQEKE